MMGSHLRSLHHRHHRLCWCRKLGSQPQAQEDGIGCMAGLVGGLPGEVEEEDQKNRFTKTTVRRVSSQRPVSALTSSAALLASASMPRADVLLCTYAATSGSTWDLSREVSHDVFRAFKKDWGKFMILQSLYHAMLICSGCLCPITT